MENPTILPYRLYHGQVFLHCDDGVEETTEEKYDLSSVMDDAGWKNEEIWMKQTEGLWRLATKRGNMICFLDFLHFLL